MIRKASVVIEKDEHGFYAWCPELKGCQSQGTTLEEAIQNIKEAIKLYIETLPPRRMWRSPQQGDFDHVCRGECLNCRSGTQRKPSVHRCRLAFSTYGPWGATGLTHERRGSRVDRPAVNQTFIFFQLAMQAAVVSNSPML